MVRRRFTAGLFSKSVRILDNRCVYTVVTTDELREYGCTVKATDGIVDQLRIIEGIEIAFLLYQTGNPVCFMEISSC